MKIAISTSSFAQNDDSSIRILESKGCRIVNNPYGRKLTQREIIKHLKGVDGLLAGLEPLDKTVFDCCPNLKAIARVGIGLDNVDLKAAKSYNILVSNTPEAPTDAVSEMTVAAALTLSRNIYKSNSLMHEKKWEKSISKGLKNANIFIIGYGRIGKKTAEKFKIFGSNILIYDPFLEPKIHNSKFKQVSMEEGLKIADIITLHAAGDEEILSKNEFRIMKNGVIILNSSRGSLINEFALISSLNSGKVSQAWLDVFDEEPYYGKLTDYAQVLLTPHISTYTENCRKEMEVAAVNNLLRDLKIK